MEDLEETMLQLHQSLERKSLSIFKVPGSNTKPVRKVCRDKISIDKMEDSESSDLEVPVNNGSDSKIPEEITHIHNNLTPDTRQDGEPKSKSKDHPRNLPAITTLKPEICKEVVKFVSSCSATTKTETTVHPRNMNQVKSTHSRMNENLQQSYSSQKNQLGERKTPQKRCKVPLIQNSNAFQHLNCMNFSMNKRNQVNVGRPSVRGRPDQFVPLNQPFTIQPTETCTSVNKTKITVSLPPMSFKTENQLLKVFFEISKLHGCDVSVDRKDSAMRDEDRIRELASHHLGSSKKLTKASGIQKRKSQQLTNKQQNSATFQELRILQSKLHSLGTQIQPIEVKQEQTQCQDSSSDSDSFPLLYPEVIMQSSP
ncbi:uncharacterized protein LOC123509983 [Portunus trituberculatus]|uniref:uncharacterized protein LOC123509983 n=1 Tax=Portunus trituberculatus TaxID=210409 RepID=UPI001E1CD03D|nr:uncharacterized protein LOC123509983 [Portunus trituberculatus]